MFLAFSVSIILFLYVSLYLTGVFLNLCASLTLVFLFSLFLSFQSSTNILLFRFLVSHPHHILFFPPFCHFVHSPSFLLYTLSIFISLQLSYFLFIIISANIILFSFPKLLCSFDIFFSISQPDGGLSLKDGLRSQFYGRVLSNDK